MSKAEIIAQLPKLTASERLEILETIHVLDHDGWLAEDLTAEEATLIEQRLAAHRANPGAAIPWGAAEERLVKQFGE